MAFKLTQGQKLAVERAIDWYFTESYTRNWISIMGFSGTGKTSVIFKLIEVLGLSKYNVLYTAFTGKAVAVLRSKNLLSHTIHRTFYTARKNSRGKVYFNLKKSLPSNIKLIVVDEAGMINTQMADDILSFGVPTVWLGDPKQLPPVMGINKYMQEENADVILTQVMRTDDKSGILTLATECREGRLLVPGEYGMSRVSYDLDELDDITEYDAVICWTNKMRRKLNYDIRSRLGLTNRYPIRGEKIICLANNYDYELITPDDITIHIANGLGCIMTDRYEEKDDETINMKFRPDFVLNDDISFNVPCSKTVFDSYYEVTEPIEKLMAREGEEDTGTVFADYGYALSCHKSQGSEYPKVLYIQEIPSSRPEFFQHVYTGVTRARVSVDVLLL